MKKVLLGLCMCALCLVGCSSDSSGDKQKLVVSTWGLNADIVKKDVYEEFEKANNCEIVVEEGTTTDRYGKLKANPNYGIDIIELSQSEAAKGYADGLFEKIDYSKIPNAKNLIKGAKDLTSSGFGPAYTVNSIGIIYDKEKVGFEIKEWKDLWKPELKGKISIPEITSTFGPAMVHIASDYKGVDIKSDNGKAAFEALKELKPNIVKTYAKSSDLANMFAADEIAAAVVGDFGIPSIQKEGVAPQATYVVPASGTYANFNTIDINATSQNKELAYKYIDWRLSKALQEKTAVSLNEAPTNADVELSGEAAKNKTYGDIAQKAKAIDYSFVNPLLEDWIDQWNRIINS